MNKLRLIVTAVFILAATYGMFTRLLAKIDQVPWWRIALFIAVFAAVVFFLLSAIKRSSGKIKDKRNEKNTRNRSPQNEAS